MIGKLLMGEIYLEIRKKYVFLNIFNFINLDSGVSLDWHPRIIDIFKMYRIKTCRVVDYVDTVDDVDIVSHREFGFGSDQVPWGSRSTMST
jgi:hypothetical protein